MRDAANVGTQNGSGLQVVQMAQLAIAQSISRIGLQHRVSACRATAQMGLKVGHAQFKSQMAELRLHPAFELLAMLQSTGRVLRQHTRFGHKFRLQLLLMFW